MWKRAILLLVVAILPSAAYSYSITNIEDYTSLDDLTPFGTRVAEKVQYWLGTKDGWMQKFYHKDSSVDKEDFGTLNSGWQGLDESDFHWHVGHGLHGLTNDGDIALYDYSIWNPGRKVDSWMVERKWDLNNEWVVFQSCYVLEDPNWAAALKYSHMLLGFETVTYIDPNLPEKFFEYAINKNWKIFDAYKKATIETFGSDVEAAVYIDAREQINDHLWGHGYVAPDEYPDDNYVYHYHWGCE